jgi:hypothetical protein
LAGLSLYRVTLRKRPDRVLLVVAEGSEDAIYTLNGYRAYANYTLANTYTNAVWRNVEGEARLVADIPCFFYNRGNPGIYPQESDPAPSAKEPTDGK